MATINLSKADDIIIQQMMEILTEVMRGMIHTYWYRKKVHLQYQLLTLKAVIQFSYLNGQK